MTTLAACLTTIAERLESTAPPDRPNLPFFPLPTGRASSTSGARGYAFSSPTRREVLIENDQTRLVAWSVELLVALDHTGRELAERATYEAETIQRLTAAVDAATYPPGVVRCVVESTSIDGDEGSDAILTINILADCYESADREVII